MTIFLSNFKPFLPYLLIMFTKCLEKEYFDMGSNNVSVWRKLTRRKAL